MTPRLVAGLALFLTLLPACSVVPVSSDPIEPALESAAAPAPGPRWGDELPAEPPSQFLSESFHASVPCLSEPGWPPCQGKPLLPLAGRSGSDSGTGPSGSDSGTGRSGSDTGLPCCEPCQANPWAVHEVPREAWGCVCEFARASWHDQLNYYSAENLGLLALGVAVAAPLANTCVDREFRDWYQQRVRSHDLDQLSEWSKVAGEHWFVIPVYVGAACVGKLFDDTAAGTVLYDWGNRTARAALVGAPSVGVLQIGLGASRPVEGGSHWRPFNDANGVAGHGYIGALPFLTAASLTDNPWLRYPLIAGSFATTWSRINDDSHYLSQSLLGWWIAYLSVRSVVATDREHRAIQVFPCPTESGPGVSVLVNY